VNQSSNALLLKINFVTALQHLIEPNKGESMAKFPF
jgi:hypothetical protein